ncbi:toll/interleukin-1 receptor domain-containing protein [Pseudoalteromonas sp. 20-92]|uniref:toll/interleukin-1 receptor domain-containing protein n=1 Tax=Pseudoalteromonas sp. 20-92 TaxID=2969394 RepID=UPI0027B076C1|nr:toll/interleukin-1 receptor domain-containing protein [Pseudoalteromonas sp. 20-92]MDQ2046112.1 toll/interleukin-1 receptor domain-containing protein [Pseudoalteromonas sp. 20-92]
MKVFISWSGDQSKDIAQAIRAWLPSVLQTVKPYFTPSDIDKGNRWSSDIADELDNSSVGIFCITQENLNSPWIMFEAGAISKKVDASLVCPILFGLGNADISGPLTQFQTTLFNKSDMYALVTTINNSNTDNVLADDVLRDVFEAFWPKLETRVIELLASDTSNSESHSRSERELLEEILGLSRNILKADKLKLNDDKSQHFNSLISSFLSMFYLVFDADWDHTIQSLDPEYLNYYISPNATFINPNVSDEQNNWGNRGSLLASYRELVSFIMDNDIDVPIKHPW